jgi:predicted negative regulator of RcsB-dependent stress response
MSATPNESTEVQYVQPKKRVWGRIIGAVVILAVLAWLGAMMWMIYKAGQKQSQDEAQIQQISTYLSAGVQLSIFPSGAQLSTLAQQRASSTAK